jgi:putative pyruvate formate lyase activating enzyme
MPETSCRLCPRGCGVSRSPEDLGVCGMGSSPAAARAAPHFGEEPCISGSRGSGTVFFSGCSLGCVFCQNREISAQHTGRVLTLEELRSVFLSLREAGCHNLNLVTPSHFTPFIARALDGLELGIPVVWNSSAFESVETLRMLEGLVQIYMPDMKYALTEPAARYSRAPDYPERAAQALREMHRQVGPYEMDRDGLLRRGLLIRHLVLPGQAENTQRVIDWVAASFEPGTVLFSLMSQYTPCGDLHAFPEIDRPISRKEYDECVQYLDNSPVLTGYVQDRDSNGREAIPDFDFTGLG